MERDVLRGDGLVLARFHVASRVSSWRSRALLGVISRGDLFADPKVRCALAALVDVNSRDDLELGDGGMTVAVLGTSCARDLGRFLFCASQKFSASKTAGA